MELKPVEVGVGAGAAVVTAFASSYLGTAGTLAGAAVASVIGTVSTSVLRSSAQRTNESLLRATERLRKPGADPDGGGATRADPGLAAVGTDAADPDAAADPDSAAGTATAAADDTGTVTGAAGVTSSQPRGPWRPRWPVLAVGAVASFVVALVAITGIESAAGKPLAGIVGNETGGGTTLSRTVDRPASTPAPTTPAPTPASTGTTTAAETPDPSPTGETTTSPTPGAPTSPTPAPSTGQPAPTSAPGGSPSPWRLPDSPDRFRPPLATRGQRPEPSVSAAASPR